MSKGTLFSCVVGCLVISGCTTSNIIKTGTDVYMVTSSGAGFSSAGVRSNVFDAANKFCGKKGQLIQPVSFESEKGKLASHPPSAELMFKCINKGEEIDSSSLTESKQLKIDQYVTIKESKQTVKKDIYTELMKLNELKEKGIISEEEFKTEKSKILGH